MYYRVITQRFFESISYAHEMLRQAQARNVVIVWKSQLRNSYHYDKNEDAIRSAALELLWKNWNTW